MAKVLLIDDEPIFYKMIHHALKPHGYELEYARTGIDGLKAVISFGPDVIITDLVLPDLSGYEIAERIRKDPRFTNIPIIFLTSKVDLSNKLKAFEVGADDYLVKPFQPEELVARLGTLVRRGDAIRMTRPLEVTHEIGKVVAVHSLRGGVGCSSLALNTAISFNKIWRRPTLVVDGVLNAGQIALMLNAAPGKTWGDLADISSYDIDAELLKMVISTHASGIDYIASPPFPVAVDLFPDAVWEMAVEELRKLYEFVIIDTAHDFSNMTIRMLQAADSILFVFSPEMASIRSAICALNIYDTLGITMDKVSLVVNQTFPQGGIKHAQIEKVLKTAIQLKIPHIPNEMVRAINVGIPFVNGNPDSTVTETIEDIAYTLSKDSLKNFPPLAPTQTWKRVTGRVSGGRK